MERAIASPAYRVAPNLEEVLRLERDAFAAKTRAARAVLGLSQRRFGELIGLTQRSVHRIEHGAVYPTMRTIVRIETFWHEHGIYFEEIGDAGFRLVVDAKTLERLRIEGDCRDERRGAPERI